MVEVLAVYTKLLPPDVMWVWCVKKIHGSDLWLTTKCLYIMPYHCKAILNGKYCGFG